MELWQPSVKETFIQTGRRGRDRRQGMVIWTEWTSGKLADHTGEAQLAEWETKDSKLTVNYCKGWDSRRNSQSHRSLHWKVELQQSKWAALFPLWPLPHRQCFNLTKRVAPPCRIPKAPSPYNITGALRQINMAQMKKQIKTPEPWLVWLSGLGTRLRTKGSPVQFPVTVHAWVAGQVSSRGHVSSNHTLIFLSLSFSPPSPLSKNK